MYLITVNVNIMLYLYHVFIDGLEVKTSQVLLSGSCPFTVLKTSLMSFCFQTQVPVNPEGVFQPSFRWVLKMYVFSSKSSILIYCRIQSVHVALFDFNNFSYIAEKEIGFQCKLFLLMFNVFNFIFQTCGATLQESSYI